ncbi:MAG: triose-phosphate isomerase [Anaerolineales bacterium]
MTARIPIVAGNWKMNMGPREGAELARALVAAVEAGSSVEVLVCPPFVTLAAVSEVIRGSAIRLGAQNVHWEQHGAYTGEISAAMLAEFCSYVIVGHSERRQYFGETDEMVNRKVRAALSHGLMPIICVGENLDEREAGATAEVVERQVRAAYSGITAEQARDTVLAYEPIWAIGTGKAATGAGANAVCGLNVRGVLTSLFGEGVAQSIRIQYGGSVKPDNMAEFIVQPDIDGALVGGASLKVEDFVGIVQAAIGQ